MVSSPFEVMETIQNSGAMMPATLRSFIATELSLSPHAVLRDAVPLMLLDGDSTVRRNAAAALEQTANPETMSPDALRRTIAVRNWVPPADRPAVDSAVRKARLAGVETGAWPRAVADMEFHATMMDGSGRAEHPGGQPLGEEGPVRRVAAAARHGGRGRLGGGGPAARQDLAPAEGSAAGGDLHAGGETFCRSGGAACHRLGGGTRGRAAEHLALGGGAGWRIGMAGSRVGCRGRG